MSKILRFTLQANEVPVEIDDRKYVLREASADAAMQYKNGTMRSAIYSTDGKKLQVEEADTPKKLLVANCLYEADQKTGNLPKGANGLPERGPVGLSFILQLRDEVVADLFVEAKDISPTLADDTLESLKKEKEILERRIARFQANGSMKEQAKNSASATANT